MAGWGNQRLNIEATFICRIHFLTSVRPMKFVFYILSPSLFRAMPRSWEQEDGRGGGQSFTVGTNGSGVSLSGRVPWQAGSIASEAPSLPPRQRLPRRSSSWVDLVQTSRLSLVERTPLAGRRHVVSVVAPNLACSSASTPFGVTFIVFALVIQAWVALPLRETCLGIVDKQTLWIQVDIPPAHQP